MSKKVVLYAEDDPNDVLFVKMGFQRAEFPVDLRIVRDGLGVIEWINGTGGYTDRNLYPMPDLIVTDLNMPARSGFDVLRFVRSRVELEVVPVIVYSSSGQHTEMRTAALLGATKYHIKASSLDELFKTINELLKLDWVPSTVTKVR